MMIDDDDDDDDDGDRDGDGYFHSLHHGDGEGHGVGDGDVDDEFVVSAFVLEMMAVLMCYDDDNGVDAQHDIDNNPPCG